MCKMRTTFWQIIKWIDDNELKLKRYIEYIFLVYWPSKETQHLYCTNFHKNLLGFRKFENIKINSQALYAAALLWKVLLEKQKIS